MTLLDEIVSKTKCEIDEDKRKDSLKFLKGRVVGMPKTLSFENALSEPFSGLIAEIKMRSPSMGSVGENTKELDFSRNGKRTLSAPACYNRHSIVKAVSVITQRSHFGGSLRLFREVRKRVNKPIIRKDFIFDEYQIWQSRALGADAILLMANVIKDASKFRDLFDLATDLGLDVLCEIHSLDELKIVPDYAKICGVNCRDFRPAKGKRLLYSVTRRLSNDSSTSIKAFDLLNEFHRSVKVAESGITLENVEEVTKRATFNAALIGTSILNDSRSVSDVLDKFQAVFRAARARHEMMESAEIEIPYSLAS